MKKREKFSIKARIKSFKYAFDGIIYFLKTVHNGWIHLLATLLVILAGIYFWLSMLEWIWIAQAIFIVFIAEFFNSAIEKTVDLVTEEKHEKAKRAKDMAAGAVLLSAIYAVIVGFFVFYPHIKTMF